MLLTPILLSGLLFLPALAGEGGTEAMAESIEAMEVEENEDITDSEEGTEDPVEPDEETEDPVEPDEETEDLVEPDEETEDPVEPDEDTEDPAEPDEDTEDLVEPDEDTEDPTEPGEENEDPAEPGEENEDPAEPDPDTEADPYANSISGMLWLDVDTYGNGIRDPGEQPVVDYPVGLYKEGDTETAVQTTETDADGRYEFTNIEPGRYVVGVKSGIIDDVEYLLPLGGIANDNKFQMADDYVSAYTEPLEIAGDTAVTDMDAGMRTPPQISPRATVYYAYYGRLVDQNGSPICNAPIFLAVLFNTSTLGNYSATSSTVTTDNNGGFYWSFSVNASTALSWDDDVILTIGFPSQFPSTMSPAPYGGYVSYTNSGRGTLSVNRNTNLPLYSGTHPHGFSRRLYRIATYDLQALESGVSITIGGSSHSARQEIKIGGTVDYTVTESFYGLDTGSTHISTQRLSSFGSIYATNTFTGKANTSFTYSGKTYKYEGYRLNTTLGPITKGALPSYPVSSDSEVNYYYAPPNYPPTAYAPTYLGGSATSVTVTGRYDLNSGTHQAAQIERSTTSAIAGFVSVGGTSNNSNAITLNENNLTPNTKYWYRTYIKTNYGGDISAASSFTTPPRVDTLVATPAGAAAGISGTIAPGSESISNVIITWAEDAGFTQNVQTINGSPGVTFDDTTYAASLTGLTAGKTYYVKVEAVGPGGTSEPVTDSFTLTTTIDVTFPTMDFHVDQSTYPNVAAGTFGQTDVYYAVVNNSDCPVAVEFSSMQVDTADGISFVPVHTSATPEIVLNLDLPDPSLTGANAFTAGVGNLDPAVSDYAAPLGVLATGSGGTPSGNIGYITLSGTYAGSLPSAAKNPKLELVFTFSLI